MPSLFAATALCPQERLGPGAFTVTSRTLVTMARVEVRETVGAIATAFGSSTFTSSQAEAAGIPSHRIVSALRAGAVIRLWRGHYALPRATADLDVPGLTVLQTAQVREAVARLAGVPVCLGDITASEAWESVIWNLPSSAVPIVHVPRESGVRSGLQRGVRFVHRVVDVERIVSGPGALPITDPLLTSIHVSAAPGLSLAQRLIALHGGMRRQHEWRTASLVSTDAQEAARLRSSSHDITRSLNDPGVRKRLIDEAVAVARNAGVRGRQRVIDSLAVADPRMETALESMSWTAFLDAGVVMPIPQASVRGSSGTLWRVDFLFSDRVIGECDGAMKYSDPQALWREKKRQEDLEQAGFIVVRWTWEEIVNRPWVVIRRIFEAIARSRRLALSA